MECLDGITLRNKLLRLDSISNETIIDWTRQIADPMLVLHSNNLLHRDLSSNNIIVSKRGKYSQLKLIDINDSNSIGTPLNMAPEAFMKKLSMKSDVFSFGCLVWEIVTCLKKAPFENVEFKDLNTNLIAFKVYMERKTLKIPEYCDSRWSQLMRDCWIFEPERRPSFYEIWERLIKMNF